MKNEIIHVKNDRYAEYEDLLLRRDAKESTEENLMKVKRLYRTIAKQLHPDINPKTEDDPKLSELWTRVVAAYHALDLKEMEELSVLVTAALKTAGIEGTEIDIPDITEKIDQLKDEIEKTRTTDPYMYGELLNDRIAVADKKQELRDNIEEYKSYKQELTGTLDKLMLQNGVQFKWEMK